MFCGQISTARAEADEFVVLAHETGEPYFKALGLMIQGLVYASGADSPAAVGRLKSALSAYRSMEATLFTRQTYCRTLQKRTRVSGNSTMPGAALTTRSRPSKRAKNVCAKPTFFASQGKLRWSSPERDAAKAEAYFDRALEVARSQQAKSWELRAATSKARLLRDQCRRTEAQDLLAPVYSWFTEGFDTLDLKEAKTLLDELASK